MPTSPVTFSSHIATITYEHCAVCHHEGASAPFNLLSYEDVSKRAKQIVEVVESRAMPPWLAEHGFGEFSNERRLTDEEKSLIRQWVDNGAPEGNPNAAPPVPQWPSGWLEGTPDLVVTMATPYELGPDGPDVYRDFVIPLSLDHDRLVRAVEFAPGNARVIHHAFIRVDEEGRARNLDGREGVPGFETMLSTAQMPAGQFLTWNPGTPPIVSPPGLAWRLPKNSDLVVEMHLNRTGKPETVQSSVGFYFTDEPPTNTCFTFKLGSYALDFPAGATNEIVRDSMVLPVDVEVLAVYPHSHFLGREIQGYAIRPDGVKEWLVWIKNWDFNWQGVYRYKDPVHLPKGTTLHLQFFYDNSTNNPANPNHPPKRVVYGEQSSDEMCELAFQVLTHRQDDLRLLQETGVYHKRTLVEAMLRQRLIFNPDDAESLTRLGMNLWEQARRPEAWEFIERAVTLRPHFAAARYHKGVVLRLSGRAADAQREFETVLRLDPAFPWVHQQLGFTFAAIGRARDAERSFEKALELNPADAVARNGLEELRGVIKARQSSN